MTAPCQIKSEGFTFKKGRHPSNSRRFFAASDKPLAQKNTAARVLLVMRDRFLH
jgi:hypothetical protein